MAADELAQGEVAVVARVARVVLERVLAVLARGLGRLQLLVEVVGAVDRQALAPVAALADEDRVAPPVVGDLVAEARGLDEGQAQHLLAEQRPRRHAVAGGKEVLHHGELAEGVGREEALVEVQVALAGVQVARGQAGVLGEEVGLDQRVAVLPAVHAEAVRHQGDAVARVRGVPDRLALSARREVPDQRALGEARPARGQHGRHPVAAHDLLGGIAAVDQGVPAGAGRQVDALLAHRRPDLRAHLLATEDGAAHVLEDASVHADHPELTGRDRVQRPPAAQALGGVVGVVGQGLEAQAGVFERGLEIGMKVEVELPHGGDEPQAVHAGDGVARRIQVDADRVQPGGGGIRADGLRRCAGNGGGEGEREEQTLHGGPRAVAGTWAA